MLPTLKKDVYVLWNIGGLGALNATDLNKREYIYKIFINHLQILALLSITTF